MKKKKQKRNIKKFILPVVVVLLSIGVLVLSTVVVFLYKDHYRQGHEQGLNNIAYHINRAVEGLVQEAPTASYSNQQFIDSAKVKFTKTESTSLLYSYNSPDKENKLSESIQLSSRILLNSAMDNMRNQIVFEELINRVPGVQSCSRLFIVTFDDKSPEYYQDYVKVFTKQLSDDRIAYIWKANSDLCHMANDSPGNELLEVMKSIESY